MNIADIIALAKMGYKKQDIKDLIDMADAKEQTPQPDPTQPDPTQQDGPKPESTTEKAPAEPEPTVKEPENVSKVSTQHESDEKVKQLEEQIKKLQEANTRKDASGNVVDDTDVIEDLVRSYM